MKRERGVTLIAGLIIVILLLLCILGIKGIVNNRSIINSAKAQTVTNANSNTGSKNSNNTSNLGKEFKRAMDTYEATMDAYISFMVNFKNTKGRDPRLLKDYANWVRTYSEAISAFRKWENSDLNKEELKYYADVQLRVSQKLINASIDSIYE